MKYIHYIAFTLAALLIVSACELPDNLDPKRPTDVPVNTMFTNAQIAFVNQVDEVNVNRNISRLLVQYWQETTYFNESRYDFQDRGIPDNYWDRFYRFTLVDFQEARMLLAEQEFPDGSLGDIERDNKVAIIRIMEAYSYQCLVDAFGNVPFTEALRGAENSTPAYDDAATVYAAIMDMVSGALNTLDEGYGSWGESDLIYNGDVASWKRFGASLLMRMGMRLADVNATAAQDAVNTAMSVGVMTDMSQSATMTYIGVEPHVNAIYTAFVVDNRKDYLPTNTIIDLMNDLEDPRRALWFTQYEGEYVGAIAGLDGAQSFNNYSNFTDKFLDPTLPAILLDYSEVEFMIAEAIERGFMGGDAAEHYHNAIEASILYWGGSQADADAYLANPDVAYATAEGDYKQKIGTQKWLAHYNQAVEGWAEWRRLDYPVINVPEGMTEADWPMRMPYPFDEDELNGESYAAAVAAMGGNDSHRVRLFWDTQ